MPTSALQLLIVAAVALIAATAAVHALLYKREPAAAFGWIAVCLLFPVAGPVLYFMLGINRIRIRAQALRAEGGAVAKPDEGALEVRTEFAQQARISQAVTGLALTAGNSVTPLRDGEAAYPRMVEAIEGARHRVYLSTYIFESNRAGREFSQALAGARRRGVDVRVLIDGAGEWYSFPRIRHELERAGIAVGRFLPPRLLPPRLLLNLRNHRKILVVDGRVAFTGGMNIGDRHCPTRHPRVGVRDIHFRLTGAVVEQIERVFIDDWCFTTGEDPPAIQRPPPAHHPNGALCRAIVHGPNEELSRLTMILVGAIAAARRHVVIVTPYFLPPRELIAALQAAAVRGTRVDIVLPAKNNLPFVHWATRNMLWELVKWGVNVYYRGGPFAHTKLFLADDHYAQVGSANLDPRSLRLNFELMVEVYDEAVVRELAGDVASMIEESRTVTLAELDGRSGPARLRDALCWLFTPYL